MSFRAAKNTEGGIHRAARSVDPFKLFPSEPIWGSAQIICDAIKLQPRLLRSSEHIASAILDPHSLVWSCGSPAPLSHKDPWGAGQGGRGL